MRAILAILFLCIPTLAAAQYSCVASNRLIIQHGDSHIFYRAPYAIRPQTCPNIAEMQTCENGTFQGSYEYYQCTEMDDPTKARINWAQWGAIAAISLGGVLCVIGVMEARRSAKTRKEKVTHPGTAVRLFL